MRVRMGVGERGRQVQVKLSCNAAHTQCDLMPCLLSNQAHGQRFLYAHNLTGFFLFYGFSNCFFNYAACGKREYGWGKVGWATVLSGLQSKHFLAIKFADNLHFHNNKNAFKTRQNFSNSPHTLATGKWKCGGKRAQVFPRDMLSLSLSLWKICMHNSVLIIYSIPELNKAIVVFGLFTV